MDSFGKRCIWSINYHFVKKAIDSERHIFCSKTFVKTEPIQLLFNYLPIWLFLWEITQVCAILLRAPGAPKNRGHSAPAAAGGEERSSVERLSGQPAMASVRQHPGDLWRGQYLAQWEPTQWPLNRFGQGWWSLGSATLSLDDWKLHVQCHKVSGYQQAIWPTFSAPPFSLCDELTLTCQHVKGLREKYSMIIRRRLRALSATHRNSARNVAY